MRGVRGLVLVLAYATLAVWMLRPVSSSPADTLTGPAGSSAAQLAMLGDVYQDVWILGAAAQKLAHDPLRVFHPAVFYPEPYALAFSEHLLGNQPVFAPLYLATGNPVLAFNLSLLVSTVLLGLGTHLLVRHWGGSHAASLVAGVLVCGAPWRVGLGAIQAHGLFIHYLPFTLLFLDRYLLGARGPNLPAAAACVFLQILSNFYAGYATLLAAGVLLLFRLLPAPARTWRAGVGLATGVALAVAASYPYLAVGVAARPAVGAGLGTFIGTPGPLTWQRVGILPVLTTALLALPPLRRRPGGDRVPVAALLVIGALGYMLAVGPVLILPDDWPGATRALWAMFTSPDPAPVAFQTVAAGGHVVHVPMPYSLFAAVLPGFSRLRGTTRLAMLPAFALPLTAAVAVDRLARIVPHVGRALLLVFAATVAACVPPVDAQAVPVGDTLPPAYRWLAAHGAGRPLLDLPEENSYAESRALYFSLFHGLPLLNGYATYPPPAFVARVRLARQLPGNREALATLCTETGLGWILLHRDRVPPWVRQHWESPPAPFRLAGTFGDDQVFAVDCPKR